MEIKNMDLYQKKSMYQDTVNKLNSINNKNQELLNELNNLKYTASETLVVDDKIYHEDDINYVINSINSTILELSNIIIPNLNKGISSLDIDIKNYEEALRQQQIKQSQVSTSNNNITKTTVNKNTNTKPKQVTYSNYSR